MVATRREGRRPERTTYRLTRAGGQELLRSVRQMVAVPRREPTEFFAGLSFLVYLDPRDAASRLEDRATRLRAEIDDLTAARGRLLPRVRRINLVEEEYLLATWRAELAWVRRLTGDVKSRRLSWNLAEILEGARAPHRRSSVKKGGKS